ncbi:MAG: hypothetical protein OSJ60_08880 [Lachnospiraceae bacterium]|nr:hypothetical protein [Lachnospiraceae bacterium]
MKDLVKIHDMCLERENDLALDIDMLADKRVEAYESRNEDVFKEILPVLNAITEDVERYREYILSEFEF